MRISRATVTALSLVCVWLLAPGMAGADHRVIDRVSSGPLGGNSLPQPISFAISRDGSRSFFVTGEPLVPEDTDAQLDVYQRAAGSTTLLSTGPTGGNGPSSATFTGTSEDGSRVFFYTAEQLTADDTDDRLDFYERTGGTTALVSTGPAGGNGDFDAFALRVSADGSTAVFHTQDQLTPDDTDSLVDLYLRAGGQTIRIRGIGLFGVSRDGQRVFFSMSRQLSPDDTNVVDDIYKWEGGTTTVQSIGPNGENSSRHVTNARIDADGRHLVFTTYGRLLPEDTDDQPDVYERVGDTLELVGPGSARAISDDGSHVFFETAERLVNEDIDSREDTYVRAGGTTRLVTGGPLAVDEDLQAVHFAGTTPDGRHAFFTTVERLTPEDTDGFRSAYQYSEGTAARYLAPTAELPRFSADGTRVFVVTPLPLVPSDTDTDCLDADVVDCEDVYEIHEGRTTLISTGPGDPTSGDPGVCVNRPLPPDAQGVLVDCLLAVSADGRRVLFWHDAPLLAGDTDSFFDIYLASAGPLRSDYKNAQSFCRAEREYLGADTFRERYGSKGKGSKAFRNCVQANRR